MEYRFFKTGISFKEFLDLVGGFFEKNGFDVHFEGGNMSLCSVLAIKRSDPAFPKIRVNIGFENDSLSVSFLTSQALHSNLMLGSVFGMFGGNWVFLANSKLKEKVDKLEEDFWHHVSLAVSSVGKEKG